MRLKTILVCTYLPRHLKKMLPLVKELRKKPDLRVHLVLMTSGEAELAQSYGEEYSMLDEFTEVPRTADFDLAWGLAPLIHAIDSIKPDLFLCIEVNYILRNAVRHCKQRHIRSVVVQHGTPNKYSAHAFVPFEGDRFVAWNDFSRQFMENHGVPPDKISVTGGIPFDRTLTMLVDRDAIAAEMSIDTGKRWFVFATQGTGAGNMPSPDEVRDGVQQAALAFSRHPDCLLLYQVHPSQEIAEVVALVPEDMHGRVVVGRYRDTEALIKVSDGMITFFSTTAIDAVLLRKPLLLINLTDDRKFFPFVDMGVAVGAYAVDEIIPGVDRLVSGMSGTESQYAEAARLMNFENDGRAMERVLDVIGKECGVM